MARPTRIYRDCDPMPDRQEILFNTERRRASPALLPALLVSLAVHAAAGGLLFSGWQRAPIEPPQPLTVTLEAAPPLVVESAPPRVEHTHVKHEANKHPAPALPLHHVASRTPVAEERVEAASPVITPAPEPAPAPTIVAKAPAAMNAPGRADAIEPPHFNVAYLNNPRPAYPPIARKLGLEGLVVLRVQVSVNGAPEQVAVAQTSGASLLDDAALRAVQGWTFVPARRGDTPVAHVVDVPIRFQLKN